VDNVPLPSTSAITELPEGITPFLKSDMQRNAFGGERMVRASKENDSKVQKPGMYYGICLSFDNLNKMVRPKEYFSKSKTNVLNLTAAYAAFNRIPLPVDEVRSEFQQQKASDLPFETWILTSDDVEVIKQDHKRQIRKILVTFMRLFKELDIDVPTIPEHKYSQESSMPSSLVICILQLHTTTNNSKMNRSNLV
jgi:hypothetical protein